MRPRNLTPALKCDKRGYAYVSHASIPNKSHMMRLGKFGTPEANQRYQQFLERLRIGAEETTIRVGKADQYKIAELLDAWEVWASQHLVKGGQPTRESDSMREALKWLRGAYGDDWVMNFGSSKLLALRDAMATSGRYCRKTVNAHLGRLKRFWKWAAARELCRSDLHLVLASVGGLRVGDLGCPESDPVQPASMEAMEAVADYLPPVVADMIEVQFWCVMRPAEVCEMHRDGLFQVDGKWLYEPNHHKTEWRGKRLVKAVPTVAYELIQTRLDTETGYIFDPEEARAWGREQAAKTRGPRKTKRFPSEERRVQAKKSNRRCSGFYTVGGYRTAIKRAIARAAEDGVQIKPFTPNEIRHAAIDWADENLNQHDAAQLLAGHDSASTTDIYRSKPVRRLAQVAASVDNASQAT